MGPSRPPQVALLVAVIAAALSVAGATAPVLTASPRSAGASLPQPDDELAPKTMRAAVATGEPAPALSVSPLPEDLNCKEGFTLDYRNGKQITLLKDMWLRGNCSFVGGTYYSASTNKLVSVIAQRDSVLTVSGTTFNNVRIEFDGSLLDVSNTLFEFSMKYSRRTKEEQVPFGGALRVGGTGRIGHYKQGTAVARISKTTFHKTWARRGGAIAVGVGNKGFQQIVGNAKLTVEDCTFHDTNSEKYGGAIFAVASDVDVSRTSFLTVKSYGGNKQLRPREDWSPQGGGAIAAFGANVDVFDSSFHWATAMYGGALFATRCVPDQMICVYGNRDYLKRATNRRSNVMIQRSDFANCSALNGGAVYTFGSTVVMDNVVVGSCHAKTKVMGYEVKKGKLLPAKVWGGALSSLNSTVSIKNSRFWNTSSDNHGGAIYSDGKTLTLSNVSIVNTSAVERGGVLALREWICPSKKVCRDDQYNDVLIYNTQAKRGGAVFVWAPRRDNWEETKRQVFEDVTILGSNASEGYGGALYFQSVQPVIRRSHIEDAYAEVRGGAIALEKVYRATVHDTVIKGAHAGQEGGALFAARSNCTGSNLTILDTRARFGAVAAGIDHSNFQLRKSYARNCEAFEFGGAFMMDEADIEAWEVSAYNMRAGDQGGVAWLTKSQALFSACNFTHGQAGIEGGAFFIKEGNTSIHNVKLDNMTPDFAVGAYATVDLKTVQWVGLQNRFLWFTDTDFDIQGMTGECPVHTELVDTTESGWQTHTSKVRHFQCDVCSEDTGILGLSSFENQAKCVQCQAHSYGEADRGCRCERGFVMNNSANSGYDPPAQPCVECGDAHLSCNHAGLMLVCPKGAKECSSAWPEDGWWKPQDSIHEPVPCPYPDACQRSHKELCASGYTGPLCMACEDNLYRRTRYTACIACKDAFGPIHKSLVLVLSAGLIFAAMTSEKVQERSEETMARGITRMSYLLNKLRITLLTFQVFGNAAALRKKSTDVMASASPVFPLVKFDMLASKHFARCILGAGIYTHYCTLLVQIPLMFFALRLVSRTFRMRVNTLRILAYNFMLVTITEESFLFWQCDSNVLHMTGKSYLLKDYEVICEGPRYLFFKGLAGVVLIIWCGVIPGYLFWRLWKYRKQINPRITGPVDFDVSTPEGLSIRLRLVQEHDQAMYCYGKATSQYVTSKLDHLQEVTPEQSTKLRNLAASCVRTRLNSTKLLKFGLRASAERRDPEVRVYRHLYAAYQPDRWYYEFINIYGRIGFAAIPVLPGWAQTLVGIMLAAGQLGSLLLRPFQRQSDTIMATVCYGSLLGLFIAHAVPSHEATRNVVTGICLLLPLITFVYFVLKDQLLPGREQTEVVEAADRLFEDVFCKAQGVQSRPTAVPATWLWATRRRQEEGGTLGEGPTFSSDSDESSSEDEEEDEEEEEEASATRPSGSSSSRRPGELP